MAIEQQYLAALELTHRMLRAALDQEWDTLTVLERERAALVAAIPPLTKLDAALDLALALRIAGIITEIESEGSEITEQVEVWQKHVRILLRAEKPAVV